MTTEVRKYRTVKYFLTLNIKLKNMEEFIKEKYLERLRSSLQYSSLPQTQIAQLIGVSKQTLSDYKSGKSYPSIEVLVKLCAVLDVSSDYLLGIDSYEK